MLNKKTLCPKCQVQITHLIEYRKQETTCDVTPEGDQLAYDFLGIGELISSEFACPSCDSTIAISEEEAIKLFTS